MTQPSTPASWTACSRWPSPPPTAAPPSTSRACRAGTAAMADPDTDIGAVLLVGKGNNFCAGGDVRAFAAASPRSPYLLELAAGLHEFLRLLATGHAPVIAAVQGWAAGAGMSLVCAADIAVGSPATRLRPAYPGIGLHHRRRDVVDAAADRRRRPGQGDPPHRPRPHRRGGIRPRHPRPPRPGRLSARRRRRARPHPRRRSALGLRGHQAPAGFVCAHQLTDQLDLERAAIAESSDSPAGTEGVNAFVEKRAPKF